MKRDSNANIAMLAKGRAELPGVLNQMGWPSLREGQEDVVNTIMAGRDVVCILPTGMGKSGGYIVPTLCMGWRTVVFSPLKSLMRDQVQSMLRMGIRAGTINSDQSVAESALVIKDWMSGDIQLLLVSPERVDNEQWMDAMRLVRPDFLVMDECHTLSAWGDNFRSAFKRVGRFVEEMSPKVVAAYSATLPRRAEVEVRQVLHIQNAERILHYPDRTNLKLSSSIIPEGAEPLSYVADWIVANCKGSTIIYCAYTKTTEILASMISARTHGAKASYYHGQITKAHEKKRNMDRFMSGDIQYMAATCAFGMGVDKSDIRNVVHYHIPGKMSELAQETGRAGRDGEDSMCHAFFHNECVTAQEYFIRIGTPDEGMVRAVFSAVSTYAKDGICDAPLDKIARKAGVEIRAMMAVMEFLKGQEVVVRKDTGPGIAKIKWLPVPSMPNVMKVLRDATYELGDVDDHNEEFTTFLIDDVASRMGRQSKTVRTNLIRSQKDGYSEFIAPDTRKPLEILQDIEMADFTFLNEKAAAAVGEMHRVQEYAINIPDEKKMQYMRESLLDAEDLKEIESKLALSE